MRSTRKLAPLSALNSSLTLRRERFIAKMNTPTPMTNWEIRWTVSATVCRGDGAPVNKMSTGWEARGFRKSARKWASRYEPKRTIVEKLLELDTKRYQANAKVANEIMNDGLRTDDIPRTVTRLANRANNHAANKDPRKRYVTP